MALYVASGFGARPVVLVPFCRLIGIGSLAKGAAGFVPLALMLPRLPFVVLTREGTERARHGRELGPNDLASNSPPVDVAARIGTPVPGETDGWIRLLAPEGELNLDWSDEITAGACVAGKQEVAA